MSNTLDDTGSPDDEAARQARLAAMARMMGGSDLGADAPAAPYLSAGGTGAMERALAAEKSPAGSWSGPMSQAEPTNTGEASFGQEVGTPTGQDLLGHAGGASDADYERLGDQFFPDPSLNNWERDASGRPTATRLGVEQGFGGLGRPEYATFEPSNVLMNRAIQEVPLLAQYANTKIERPTVYDIYGYADNTGGGYQPSTGRVVMGRGAEAAGEFAPGIAVHELLHKVSAQLPFYRTEMRTHFEQLRNLVQAEAGGLQSLGPVSDQALRYASDGDWPHVFTTLALAAAQGRPLPPRLSLYFSPLRAR